MADAKIECSLKQAPVCLYRGNIAAICKLALNRPC